MNRTKLFSAVMIALYSSASFAEININGFASIYAGKASGDSELYGYEDEFSFANESKFAIQVMADLTDSLTATAQLIARGNDDFNAAFEWAYVTYAIDGQSQLSAGKMRIPFYKYSDFLDVGYAYRWVRPPQSVYGLSFSTYEGLSYLHNGSLGDFDSTIQVLYGSLSEDIKALTGNDRAEMNNIMGINWTLSYDWFSYRIAYLVAEVNVDESNSPQLSGLIAGLDSYGLTQNADLLRVKEDDGYFLGTGFSIDYNNMLLDAEYTELEVENSVLAPQSQYFVSAGYRFDEFVVHTTFERNKDEHDQSRYNTVPVTVVHPQLGLLPVTTDPTNPNAPYLRDLTNAVYAASFVDTQTWSIGMRYDFHPSAAFKIDYSKLKDKPTGATTNVISFGVDLVFQLTSVRSKTRFVDGCKAGFCFRRYILIQLWILTIVSNKNTDTLCAFDNNKKGIT